MWYKEINFFALQPESCNCCFHCLCIWNISCEIIKQYFYGSLPSFEHRSENFYFIHIISLPKVFSLSHIEWIVRSHLTRLIDWNKWWCRAISHAVFKGALDTAQWWTFGPISRPALIPKQVLICLSIIIYTDHRL